MKQKRPYKDLTGRRSGRLTVIKWTKPDNGGNYLWLCQCDCGNTTLVRGQYILKELIISCGCAMGCYKNTNVEVSPHSYLFRLRTNMLNRCLNSNDPNYKNYGGRGIKIYQPWIKSYAQFEKDILNEIGEKPTSAHSLDRINNDGNYEPGNIRWATKKEQSNNKRPLTSHTNTGHKGIYLQKNGRYIVRYYPKAKQDQKHIQIHGGTFDTIEEAIARYEYLKNNY